MQWPSVGSPGTLLMQDNNNISAECLEICRHGHGSRHVGSQSREAHNHPVALGNSNDAAAKKHRKEKKHKKEKHKKGDRHSRDS